MALRADSPLASIPIRLRRPNVDVRERMEKPKNVQQPQNRHDHHHSIQNGLDRVLHRNVTIDQPKNYTHRD
jgi:hypothetical protein